MLDKSSGPAYSDDAAVSARTSAAAATSQSFRILCLPCTMTGRANFTLDQGCQFLTILRAAASCQQRQDAPAFAEYHA
jgi:hypothetical protein